MKSEVSRGQPLGVALIGCGRISDSHLDAIQALPQFGRLVAAVDPDLARATAVSERYGAPHALDDLGAALALDEVQAVCICTPNDLHASQSLQALAAGRHVLVEKPMAETPADAAAMSAAAERTGLVLAVGMTLRHTAPIRYLQDHRHDFGALRAVEFSTCVHWKGPQAPWWATRTPREGLILSLFAPHALDFVQLVMGEDPVQIMAVADRHQRDWVAEDEAMILLRYPGHRMASLHLSYNQSWVLDRKTLHFDKAMLRIEDGDFLWVDDELVVQPSRPQEDSHRMGGRDLSGYFRTQFEEFVLAVWGRPNRSVLHDEGRRLTALTDAVILSALEHSPGL